MSKTFFTADPHFGHANIIRYCGRPFETKEEHDRILIENWNSRVTPRDTTYLIGDLGFGNAEYLKKVLGKLHGKIHFLRGNHDKSSVLDIIGGRFASIKDVSIIHPQVNGRKQTIFLSHYAHRSWYKSNHGSWHLWGHSHGNLPPWGLSFDVGVDSWDFTPVSLEQISNKMASLTLEKDYSPSNMDLSKLSDSELKEKARKLSFDVAKYNNYQLTKKIQLNSAYGAMGSEYFRFFDIRLATAVTASGQLVIQWLARDINKYMNHLLNTVDVDYIIAIDTDSLYLRVDKIVPLIFPKMPEDKNKVVTALDKFSENKIQLVIDQSCKALREYLNAYAQKMVMKRESIADKAIWVAKKRYVLNILDKEGVRYQKPKVAISGIEAVRSSTPEVCRGKIKDGITLALNKTQTELHKYISDFKKEFKTLKPEEVAFPRGCNGLDEYADAQTIFKKGTPMHVRGALVYNKMIRDMKIKNYPCIQDGDKIKFLYLKGPNSTRGHVIAMTESGLPDQFNLSQYIDYNTQFEKTFLDPLKIILTAIDWTAEKTNNLDDIFGD